MSTLPEKYERAPDEHVDWQKSVPFFLVHLVPLGLFWTGIRLRDVILCIALYYGRMFFITAGYHRYFAHRTFKTSRWFQFVLAFGGATSAQKGVLWWAAHHRNHHKYSDQPEDVHSPKRGFWWSHVGWILCNKYEETPAGKIKDFEKYPELRWLNRHHLVPPILLGAFVFFFLGGVRAVLGGFFLSTVLLYHGTFVINSLTHVWGSRRYVTTDTSRNNFWLALVTMGEGWHNNHHYFQSSANQGFFWWEIDLSFYVLKALSFIGVVWDVRVPPKKVLEANRIKDADEASAPRAQPVVPPAVSVEAA